MAINNMKGKEQLKASIELCMKSLHEMLKIAHEDRIRRASYTLDFMSNLFELYLIIQQDTTLKELREYQIFLKQSFQLLPRAYDDIAGFVMSIENLFIDQDPYDDPLPAVCWRRSALEGFKEMYQYTQETDLKEYLDLSNEDFETDDIDHMIESYIQRQVSVDKDKIPPNTPRSHWWWGEKAETEAD